MEIPTMALSRSENWQSGRTLSQSAGFMLENKIATDITFKFPNTTHMVEAHRFVLMARSHVFYVMLNSALGTPGDDIEITDVEPDIFKDFLIYLYTDEIALSADKALHLTYCAEKYEVTDLKAKCTEFLQTHVDEKAVAMVLDHAVLYSDKTLISTCQDIIESLKSFKCLEECHMTKETLGVLLGFQGLIVSELDIFKFCNLWADQECTIRNIKVNASNRRKMLGTLLRKIPFCSMSQEDFSAEVSGKHLLNGQEELQIFRFLCGTDKSNPPFPCKTDVCIKQVPPVTQEYKGEENWKLNTFQITQTGSLNCMAVTPDDSMCALGGKFGKVIMRDLNKNKVLHIVDCGEVISALSFSPTRYWLCTATGLYIKIWGLKGMVCLDELWRRARSRSKADPPDCICLSWSDDGDTLSAGYTDNSIHIWKVGWRTDRMYKLKTSRLNHTGYLNYMTISVDGSLCATRDKEDRVQLWDMSNGTEKNTIEGNDTITAMSLSPKHYWIVLASGPLIKIWDLETMVIIHELGQHVTSSSANAEPPQCTCLTWSADGQTIFAGYTDNFVRMWQVPAP